MLKDQLLTLNLNIFEAIVAVDDFTGTLCEFLEINSFSSYDTFSIVAHLLNQGHANIDQGNGDFTVLKLLELEGAQQPFNFLAA